jgi:hypothetical protein
LFLAGLFCGLAVSLRIQLAPAVAFAALYFCRRNWRKGLPAVSAGLLLPVLGFGLVDAFTWSYPFQSFLLYYWVNIVKGRAAFYGTEPWYWYLLKMAMHFGPMLILALLGVRRSPFLGWIALLILVPLSAISHKEVRFIYPLVPITITLAALGIGEIADKLSLRMGSSLPSRSVALVGLAFCVIISGFIGSQFTGWKDSGSVDHRVHIGSLASAFDRLSRESVCGVGSFPVYPVDDPDPNDFSHPGPGAVTGGGYAHLHQNVPIVAVPPGGNLGEPSSFNVVLSLTGKLGDAAHDFKLEQCWGERPCVYRRAGACTAPSPENLANAVLEHAGQ